MEIQWFPGHMLKTQRLIQEHRSQVDVFLEVVDSRAPLATANPLLDELLGEKPRVVLLNKIDLADPRTTAAWKAWYDQRPETCRLHPQKKSPKPGYCAYGARANAPQHQGRGDGGAGRRL